MSNVKRPEAKASKKAKSDSRVRGNDGRRPGNDERESRNDGAPLVGIVMGSKSDWETMRAADKILTDFGVAHECCVLSAHRTPERTAEYSSSAQSRGIRVLIAGAGGAAHLAGVIAAHTPIPVLGVPVESGALHGLDSLLSIVQMPGGVPVATFSIGKAGATNAALFAVAILAATEPRLGKKLDDFRSEQSRKVLAERLP
jgi:5-(carboxyamino)imidazole ribonucleotide mutase